MGGLTDPLIYADYGILQRYDLMPQATQTIIPQFKGRLIMA